MCQSNIYKRTNGSNSTRDIITIGNVENFCRFAESSFTNY